MDTLSLVYRERGEIQMFDKSQMTTLGNGIRIFTDKMPGLECVSINTTFHVGSCHEELHEHGTAHFLEHLTFQGTARRSAEEIQDEIARYGGAIDAFTDWDTTTFRVHILKEHIARAIDVISDLTTAPLLASDDVDKERNIILHELKSRYGSRSVLYEGFYEAAFGDQSLARPIIGSEESIMDITADMLRSFHQRYYVASNLIVSVAGDIEHTDVVNLVENAFASLPVGNAAQLPTVEYLGGEAQFACSCESGMVLLGYPTPPTAERSGTAISLFRNILGGGPTSRLFRELREKRGLVYDASAYTNYHIRNPFMVLDADGHANNVKDLFMVMYDQVHDTAANATEEELEIAKTLMISGLRMSRDMVYERSSEAVFELCEIGMIRSLQEQISQIESIDLEFFRQCATDLIARPATLAAHGPVRHLPKLKHAA